MSYLRRFAIDRIKIGRSSIADLERSESSAAIVRAALGLSASLHVATSAGGVENKVQLAILRQ